MFLQIAIQTLIGIVFSYITIKYFAKRNDIGSNFIKYFILTVLWLLNIVIFLLSNENTKEIAKSLVTGSSILIAVVIFACQKLLSNLIAGIVISMSKPFDVNNKITILNGSEEIATGFVQELTLRHTIIKQIDGRCVLIPNEIINECSIVNCNTLENNGYPLELEIGYNSDTKTAMQIIEESVINNALTINSSDNTTVTCAELTQNGYLLKCIVWTKTVQENFLACSQLRIEICKKFIDNEIIIPYQTITLK